MLQVKLLEMPLAELEQNIDVELDDNPALEATHDDFDDIQTDNASHDNEPHDAADNDVQDSTNDDSMETAMADDNYERKSEREEREEALDNALANLGSDDEMPQASPYAQSDNNDNADYEETVWGDTTSFYDNLKEQMGMLELTDQQQEVMEYLIGSLDDDATDVRAGGNRRPFAAGVPAIAGATQAGRQAQGPHDTCAERAIRRVYQETLGQDCRRAQPDK